MKDKQPNRFFIPPWLDDLDIKANPFRVFCHLLRRAGSDGKCFTKVDAIAKACHIHKDTIWPCLRTLENAGLIRRLPKGFGGCNSYEITPPISGKGWVIDGDSISGKTGVIEVSQSAEKPGCQSAEKPGCQSAEKPGCQSAEKPGCKVIPLKESNLKESKNMADAMAEKIWDLIPPKGRERSSKKQLKSALEKISPDRHDEILASLEAWNLSDHWTKDAGQYVPGVHRWINDGKWQMKPQAANGSAPETMAATLASLGRRARYVNP